MTRCNLGMTLACIAVAVSVCACTDGALDAADAKGDTGAAGGAVDAAPERALDATREASSPVPPGASTDATAASDANGLGDTGLDGAVEGAVDAGPALAPLADDASVSESCRATWPQAPGVHLEGPVSLAHGPEGVVYASFAWASARGDAGAPPGFALGAEVSPPASSGVAALALGPDCQVRWSRWFVGAATVAGVASDAQGNVTVAGAVSGDLDLGSATLAGNGAGGGFVVRLDPSGHLAWSHALLDYPHAEAMTVHALASGADGLSTVALSADERSNLGGGPDPLQTGAAGGTYDWLVQLAPDGHFLVQVDDRQLAGGLTQIRRLSAAPDGTLRAVAWRVENQPETHLLALPSPLATSSQPSWNVRLSLAADPLLVGSFDVVVGSDGAAYVTTEGPGGRGAVLAVDAHGSGLWSSEAAANGGTSPLASGWLAVDRAGARGQPDRLAVAGYFHGSLALRSDVAIVSAGGEDLEVQPLMADGTREGPRRWGGVADDEPLALDFESGGGLVFLAATLGAGGDLAQLSYVKVSP